MRKKITTENFESGTKVSLYFHPVKKCPLCHSAFNGEIMASSIAPYEFKEYGEAKRDWALYALHYCQVCGLGFCGIYSRKKDSDIGDVFKPVIAVPENNEPLQLDPEISKISPSFVKIFEEAYAAEKSDLTLICGMGYRKALEFLVKDYLIEKDSEAADAIAKEPLAQSIRRIDNQQIRILAERSAWLGNDETHYTKKHDGYSYKDIKSFLEAIVAFILYEKTVEKAFRIPRR
ncbi:MAG: hypothetical protein UCO57_14290 [Gemmiger sp.]|uniref:hypothetical protein n=1 Tax=Gemmiger sp. TaxID=2049027 RepID=UPI002E76C924|nr:hypothetical protein [Gemmiger sp.]MEE0709933.1 hypothetical protein [Gemmiger sp.]